MSAARTSISFDADLMRRAKERAKTLGLDFSSYVGELIWNDLDKGGPLMRAPSSKQKSPLPLGLTLAAVEKLTAELEEFNKTKREEKAKAARDERAA